MSGFCWSYVHTRVCAHRAETDVLWRYVHTRAGAHRAETDVYDPP